MTREELDNILEEAFLCGYEDANNDIIQEKMDNWHKDRAKSDIDYVRTEYRRIGKVYPKNKEKAIIAGKAFHQYWSDYKDSKDPNKRKMAIRMYNASKRYDNE